MSPSSPPPRSLDPFQRLQVSDGLLITAERWQQSHNYHRQRQNVHFQALHQGGIVWGLGVSPIDPPLDVADEYRDRRWLCIQPGLAIDGRGNPIVVPQPMPFRIASTPPEQGGQLVYLSIRYVDPDKLQGQGDREWVIETFRIEETTTPPHDLQIQLCRILLQPGEVQLQPAHNVLAPGSNQLDLRDRPTAHAQSPIELTVALASQGLSSAETTAVGTRFSSLFSACSGLFPAMRGNSVTAIPVRLDALSSFNPDLLYLPYGQFRSLSPAEQDVLKQYLGTGALVFVEISAQDAGIADFSVVREQLIVAIANVSPKAELADIRQELDMEKNAMTTLIEQQIITLCAPLQAMAEPLGFYPDEPIPFAHPLRSYPFLFSQFPLVEGCPIYLKLWGGIVLAIGSLSKAWGLDDTHSVSRDALRAAQELGINLLHFAWRRHQLTKLQQGH
jgi:hypothetical protein